MHEERYSASRLLKSAAAWLAGALLFAWIGGWAAMLAALVLAAIALRYALLACGDRVAIRFGQDKVELNGLGSSLSSRWDAIGEVVIVRSRPRMFGLLPLARSPHLTVIDGRTGLPLGAGVPIQLLDLDRSGLERLVAVLMMSSSGAFDLIDPRTGKIREEQEAAPSPASRGFGRRGLAASR